MTTLFQKHVKDWSKCTKCSLCNGRRRVVLFRGSVPCDVLFIGEAPGESEDVLGQPFIGPAGQLLDHIVECALREAGPVTCGFTNVVACIPRGGDGVKASEPGEEAMSACLPRLKDVATIAKPKLIVLVGSVAGNWMKKKRAQLELEDVRLVDLTHPAAILRANAASQGLAIKKCIIALSSAMEEAGLFIGAN